MQHSVVSFPARSMVSLVRAPVDASTAVFVWDGVEAAAVRDIRSRQGHAPSGGCVAPASVAQAIPLQTKDSVGSPSVELSEREREAIGWIGRGLTQKEAAYEMGIAASTLRVLLFRAAKKRRARQPHPRPLAVHMS